jgi:hypothetical protein
MDKKEMNMPQLEDILERLAIIEEDLHYLLGELEIEKSQEELVVFKEAIDNLTALETNLWSFLDILKREFNDRNGQKYRGGQFEIVQSTLNRQKVD